MKFIDLRSDTVTKPSKAMLNAMVNCEVGDDVYGEDPTVNKLESLSAEILGKDAAVFTPSGTQSNLLALLTHCERGDEYIAGQESHVYKNEVKKLLIIFYQSCMIFFIWFAFTGCKSQMNNIRINQLPAIDSTVSFRGIYAVSDTKVWATGSSNAIFRTNNGGQSWEQMIIDDSLTLDFRDVHITSVGDIFVMSSGPGNQSRIYRSSDNGETWDISYINPHDEGFLNSTAFWNDSTGIAVGDPVNGQIFILVTHDSGSSWNVAQPGTIPPALPGAIGFAASGTSVAVYGDSLAWIGTGGPEARVYYTTDLGTSWHVTNTPFLHGGETTGIYSVQFFQRKYWFYSRWRLYNT